MINVMDTDVGSQVYLGSEYVGVITKTASAWDWFEVDPDFEKALSGSWSYDEDRAALAWYEARKIGAAL